MKSRPEPTIIAIDPGTAEMGVAVFEGDSLEYFGVKAIKRKTNADQRVKARLATVKKLINRFHPSVLVMEKTFFSRINRSSILNVLTDEIQHYAFRQGLRICGFAPTTVKKMVTGNGKATKADVARKVASQHPELIRYLNFREDYRRKYWQNMFDAVAVGLTFQKREKMLSSFPQI